MKRRDFLKKTVTASAAGIVIPTIIPSSALGMNGATPPSDRLVMAAIGLGGMGKANMTALLKTGKTQFIGVCDLDKTRRNEGRNALNKFYGNTDCLGFEDYIEMLDKLKLDAVTIAVPDQWHAMLYTHFANKGLHIYGEKPLTRSIYEGQKVVAAVKKNGIVWQTGSWQRSTAQFHRAVDLIRNGAIGNVQRIEVGLPNQDKKIGMPDVQTPPDTIDYNQWVGPSKFNEYRGILHWDWRWIQNYSGGQITDWGAHHIDIALWAMNMDRSGPEEIEGKAWFNKGDLFDVAHSFDVDYKLPGNIPMKVCNASRLEHGMGTVWYGDEGWLHVSRQGIYASDQKILDMVIPKDKSVMQNNDEHHMNFVKSVFSKKEPVAHIEAAHRANSCSLLGEIAFMTGEKLKWDPANEHFIGASEKAQSMLKRVYRKPFMLL